MNKLIATNELGPELARMRRERMEREGLSLVPESEPPKQPEWPVIDDSAYYGLAGDIVRTIEPHTEADPVALLLQILALAGNVIGRAPYYQIESDYHRANLFAVLVGDSAKSRKGTSLGRVRAIAKVADETWNSERNRGGLSSGEGLIDAVRDEVQKYNPKEKQFEIVDPGVPDKRLMVVEPEFAGVLSVAERHGNTITQLIRQAWDNHKLQTMTRSSSLSATNAHISVIGHITADELRARLSRTDTANGFANRFLYALVKRSKEMPFGSNLTDSEILHLGDTTRQMVDWTAGSEFFTNKYTRCERSSNQKDPNTVPSRMTATRPRTAPTMPAMTISK